MHSSTATELLSSSQAAGRPGDTLMLEPGQLFERCYLIESILGVGGMGRVYGAHDRVLDRPVAIKIAHESRDADTLIREARVMAGFRHRGLPAVYRLGRHRKHYYLVMERLEGTSLAMHMRRGSHQPLAEALHILRGVCASLQALHGIGLAHRDLKPSNIMLEPSGRVVLVDFGICDFEHRVPHMAPAGSAHYMAPEMAMEIVEEGQGHLADLYALGVLGFALLCGRTPFSGSNMLEVLDRQLLELAPSARRYRADLPEALIELLARLLARDPNRRPTSIEHVARQLAGLETACRWPSSQP